MQDGVGLTVPRARVAAIALTLPRGKCAVQRQATIARGAKFAAKATPGAGLCTLCGVTRIDAAVLGEPLDAVARLAAIIETSQDAIIGKTLDGVITSWSAGAEQMYGYRPEEIIGRNIRVLVPPDRASELDLIMEQVARGESVQQFETQRLTKDGRVLDMFVAVSAIRDSNGAVIGAATVARDLTEIHGLQQANVVLNNLAGAVERRDMQDEHHLTTREHEVLELMAQGLPNKQVAARLGLRLNTIRNHSQSILYKLGAHSRLEAVATAVRDGIIRYPFETLLD